MTEKLFKTKTSQSILTKILMSCRKYVSIYGSKFENSMISSFCDILLSHSLSTKKHIHIIFFNAILQNGKNNLGGTRRLGGEYKGLINT